MIIWRGLGFLVAIISFLCLVLAEAIVESIYNNESYYQDHGWPAATGLVIAAAILWPLGRKLNQEKAKVLVDKETGEELILEKHHDFFFIRMEYWAPILIVIGIVFIFVW
jgi:hypothetical protein